MHRYVKYYFKLRAVAETVRSVLPQELLEKSGAARLEVWVLSGEFERVESTRETLCTHWANNETATLRT